MKKKSLFSTLILVAATVIAPQRSFSGDGDREERLY